MGRVSQFINIFILAFCCSNIYANGSIFNAVEKVVSDLDNKQYSKVLAPKIKNCSKEKANLKLDEQNLPKKNDDYFEYHMTRMLYYSAEMVDIYYTDGKGLRIGITEPWTRKFKPNIQQVDCYTKIEDLYKLNFPGIGYRFIDRDMLDDIKELPFDVIEKYSTKVEFTKDPVSGRIVPSHINNLTAPHICKILRDTEKKYVEEFDAFANGMLKVLGKSELIVNLMLFSPSTMGLGPTTRYRPFGWPKVSGRASGISTSAFANAGLSSEAAAAALSGMNKGGGHAMRKFINIYKIIPNIGSHMTKLAKFKDIVTPILKSPYGRPFSWATKGGIAATGYLKQITVNGLNRWVMVQVAKEGAHAGKVLTAYIPRPHQLEAMFKQMAL